MSLRNEDLAKAISFPNSGNPGTDGPDIRQINASALPETPFPGGRDQDFRVFFSPEVYPTLWSHARADTSVEVCGVLVGGWGRDADGPFVNVSGSIQGDAAENKFAEVTFTHQTWAKINDEMDKNYPSLTIVGWYHTHPDFGVFLSDRDVFIQQHFFSEAGHIAHVIDPVRKTEGVFVWRRGKPALTPFFWVGSELKTSTPAGAEGERSAMLEAPASSRAVSAAGSRASLVPPVEQLLAYLCLLLLGYLLASYRSTWSENRLFEGAVAHYGLWQGLRPGLGDQLDQVSGRVREVSKVLDVLAADHLKRLGKDEKQGDVRKAWEVIQSTLGESSVLLARIKSRYELSPTEMMIVRDQLLKKLEELEQPPPTGAPEKEKPKEKEPVKPEKPEKKEKIEPKQAPSSGDPSARKS